jgi:hypothetical protein
MSQADQHKGFQMARKIKCTVQKSNAKVFVEVEYRLPSGPVAKTIMGGDSIEHCIARFKSRDAGHCPIVSTKLLPESMYDSLR